MTQNKKVTTKYAVKIRKSHSKNQSKNKKKSFIGMCEKIDCVV